MLARTVHHMTRHRLTWILAAVAVRAADALSTWVALGQGHDEANPAAVHFFDRLGFWPTQAVTVIPAVLLGLACATRSHRWPLFAGILRTGGRVILAAHLAVVLSNIGIVTGWWPGLPGLAA